MKTWIKLYTEALHDRKMRRLNRFDKSVFYDLLLLAGQEDNDGQLPCIEDIALELDLKKTEAQKSVTVLMKVGLLSEGHNGDPIVTKFKTRQESNLTGAEKTARYRERLQQGHNQVTDVTEKSHNKVTSVTGMLPECKEKVTVEVEEEVEEEVEVEEEKRVNARPKNPKPEKQKYGSMQNVLLTPEEYGKLCEKFDDADAKIENLSLGIASKGYKYKDHYATILTWARKDAERAKALPSPKTVNKYPDIYTMLKAEEQLI